MGKNERRLIEVAFITCNALILSALIYFFMRGYILFEIFMALVFMQGLASAFLIFLYLMHRRFKRIANEIGFEFITRFLEQPRMEGLHKKNWFQIHFTSRSYSEYWGMPRTYIKLQFKEQKKFDDAKLKKYENFQLSGLNVKNVQHIIRPYKNYLLMRVDWYVLEKGNLIRLMDLLIKIEKEAKLK
jgi:hypothetical protein